jgi:integrase
VYVSQKTHIKAELPIAPAAQKILFAKGTPFAGAYKRTVSDHTFNDIIRLICEYCDIVQSIQLYRNGQFWTGKKFEAVSSHTSRRSFCTNLYLRCRDIYLVSKLAGHSSTTVTTRYICCGIESLTEAAMNYFRAF